MASPPSSSAAPPPTPASAPPSPGLENLEGLVLETIITKAGARPAAALACCSAGLRAAVSQDAVWRRFCADDLGLAELLGPDGRRLTTFKEAYNVWFESFGMYPLPLVRRVKNFWSSMKSWLSTNFPEALTTLSKGASEAQIKSAEVDLGFELPMPMKVLYRFCNGQLPYGENHIEDARMAPHGLIGGYIFYDHCANVHLAPLTQIVKLSKEFYDEVGSFRRPKLIVVAVSWYYPKTFFLDCSNGQLYVGNCNLVSHGELIPCVPKPLIRPTVNANNDVPQDGLLLWLEEHLRRLQSGMIKTRPLKNSRYISLYPEALPSCSSAVANGVKVRASSVFVPECSGHDQDKYYYSYSIRLSLMEGCMLGGVYYSSCQLHSRHWLIRSGERIVSDVHGEGVIGEYPLLSPDKEEFVYESCTAVPEAPGSVEGHFTFVPGRLDKPEGKPFDVTVAPFPLEKPKYIF